MIIEKKALLLWLLNKVKFLFKIYSEHDHEPVALNVLIWPIAAFVQVQYFLLYYVMNLVQEILRNYL